MENNSENRMIKGFQQAFYDHNIQADEKYLPKFLSNNADKGEKFTAEIEQELMDCDEFVMSVAFITRSGIEPLLQAFKELNANHHGKNVKGKILTTDYKIFTEPSALKALHSNANIELRMYRVNENDGFHTKGYIFKQDELYHIIVGSSNLTGKAIATNYEWNTKMISTNNGEYTQNILEEFEQLWNSPQTQTYDEFFTDYEQKYQEFQELKKISVVEDSQKNLRVSILEPNSMQQAFIENLMRLKSEGANRALLISATGTGKTYAAAFAVKRLQAKKMLFLVHREQIAAKAAQSFQKVFGSTRTYGLLSGSSKNYNPDFLFSTMNMMAKEETLVHYDPSEFDVIVIDESHHAGAESYQRIMKYFHPDFWLGMTASPDRMDGFNIYETFDYNIACEIRLQQAMEENLLCPFHYFGIHDAAIDERSDFSILMNEDRIDMLIQNAAYYGYSGSRVKGLIFCSSRKEGSLLEEKLNERGIPSKFLSGENSEEERIQAVERLESDFCENPLSYIITVDIFNEGIDIPQVNQVLLLRPTLSPVIFVQQLGRGLRKATDKEFVVILDFIGNYTNNFMIPMALSGERTYNRDDMIRYVTVGNRIIPGNSTIHFDEISKQRIYDSIRNINLTQKIMIKEFLSLKRKLGRTPLLMDFYENGELDPILFLKNKSIRTYDRFLRKADRDEVHVPLTDGEEQILDFVSQYIADGKRIAEIDLLRYMQKHASFTKEEVQRDLGIQDPLLQSAIHYLSLHFVNRPEDRKRYRDCALLVKEGETYVVNSHLYGSHANPEFTVLLEDVITLAETRYQTIYQKDLDSSGFSRYQKYTRRDACHILNWPSDYSSTVYGYKIFQKTCPIFVTYVKRDDISSTTQYEDSFLNEEVFSWMSRSRVRETSPEAQALIHSNETGLQIPLFIKKDDKDSDFYYMGLCNVLDYHQTMIQDDAGHDVPIMNFKFRLNHPVRADIYEFLERNESYENN